MLTSIGRVKRQDARRGGENSDSTSHLTQLTSPLSHSPSFVALLTSVEIRHDFWSHPAIVITSLLTAQLYSGSGFGRMRPEQGVLVRAHQAMKGHRSEIIALEHKTFRPMDSSLQLRLWRQETESMGRAFTLADCLLDQPVYTQALTNNKEVT